MWCQHRGVTTSNSIQLPSPLIVLFAKSLYGMRTLFFLLRYFFFSFSFFIFLFIFSLYFFLYIFSLFFSFYFLFFVLF